MRVVKSVSIPLDLANEVQAILVKEKSYKSFSDLMVCSLRVFVAEYNATQKPMVEMSEEELNRFIFGPK